VNFTLNAASSFGLAWASPAESASRLRGEAASLAIGIVLLTLALTGIALYFLRSKMRDRSLLFFSVFALLYAIRLIFRQTFFQSMVPLPAGFWIHCDEVVDNFIVVPYTLFLIEIVPARWKMALRWILALQIVFATARLSSQLSQMGRRPIETAYHLLIAAYCGLLIVYPLLWARRGQRLSREVKVVYVGFVVFALFVVHTDLMDLGVIGGHNVEAIGFLALVCCLGYVAALRTYANEQRLLSIQRELEIARQIQSAILPQEVPRLRGISIAARYLPMAAVAGDFYDFLVVDEQRVGILVADVTGHGVPAALIASLLKSALAAQAAHAPDPGQVLAGLNCALCGKFEAHFVTAGYLYVDGEKHVIRYGAGGHPPLLFGSRDRGTQTAIREVESNGLLLGVSETATYRHVEFPFVAGDRCLLYTDGILEAMSPAQEEFGASRLLRLLQEQANLSAGDLVAEVLRQLARWSGRGDGDPQEDDITLVAVDLEPALSAPR
jgi:sigma-B regulation protein RsbU (phosphoserine phosphatase)